jgi:hypothetical protein
VAAAEGASKVEPGLAHLKIIIRIIRRLGGKPRRKQTAMARAKCRWPLRSLPAVEAARMRSRHKLQRRGPTIKGVLVQVAKMFKLARIISMVGGKQLSRPSKGAQAAMAAEAVNSLSLFSAGCKVAETLICTIGATA